MRYIISVMNVGSSRQVWRVVGRGGVVVALSLSLARPVVAETNAVPSLVGRAKARLLADSLIGAWKAEIGKEDLRFVFQTDGSYTLDGQPGRFTVSESGLALTPATGSPVVYTLDPGDGQFVLGGGDLTKPLTFTQDVSTDRPLRSYFHWVFSISPGRAKEKALRLITIGLIIGLAVLLIQLLRAISAFIIYSELGPLKYFFQRHKTRTRTIHSVVLNLVKYVIIFSALGRILMELGVNYTTYIASLSVIGLAIGFGSQGLVQDVVTGLFLILDGQLGVGDMVEISGVTGLVEEVGLRTTRLRTYVGQVVVILNRNISLTGNYTKGALQVVIDVAVADEAAGRPVATAIDGLTRELARQFEGTVLHPPAPAEVLALQTGETYVRVVFDLWPQQQALAETQLVPRIKELLAARGFTIPHDRIAITNRPPDRAEQAQFLQLRQAAAKLFERFEVGK